MSENKHTEGEWGNTGLEIRNKKTSMILAKVHKHLQANQSEEEALANAKLIAAAPEMLEALYFIIIRCSGKGQSTHFNAEEEIDMIYQIAHETIKKVKE